MLTFFLIQPVRVIDYHTIYCYTIENNVEIRGNHLKIKTIKDSYFEDNNLVECLENKEQHRPYLYVLVRYEGNNIFIPFRSKLNENGNLDKIINVIAYDISSSKKPYAKLDFSKMLIINDEKYINSDAIVDSTQYTKIKNDIEKIEKQAVNYISGYIKAVGKGRSRIDGRYRFSTLVNYHGELGLWKK